MATGGTYGFDNAQLEISFEHFNKSLASANTTYDLLVKLRDRLISEGWKGNSSQNFYTRIAEYINQIEKLREHLSEIVNKLYEARKTTTPVEEEASQGA